MLLVIYSIATFLVDEVPRGMEFFYSLNRFNVAIFWARVVFAVVCFFDLLAPFVYMFEQMCMVNVLCVYVMMSAIV